MMPFHSHVQGPHIRKSCGEPCHFFCSAGFRYILGLVFVDLEKKWNRVLRSFRNLGQNRVLKFEKGFSHSIYGKQISDLGPDVWDWDLFRLDFVSSSLFLGGLGGLASEYGDPYVSDGKNILYWRT